MADTYTLYLKTQNYHWHVKGPYFKSMHELFEVQYKELAEAIDLIAERIRALGHQAPATYKEFEQLRHIKDGDATKTGNEMIIELAHDNEILVNDLKKALASAQKEGDEGTVTLLGDRLAAHEKAIWMLNSTKI